MTPSARTGLTSSPAIVSPATDVSMPRPAAAFDRFAFATVRLPAPPVESVSSMPLPVAASDAVSVPVLPGAAFIASMTSPTVTAPERSTESDDPSRSVIVMSSPSTVDTPLPPLRSAISVSRVMLRMPRSVAVVPPFSPIEKSVPDSLLTTSMPVPASLMRASTYRPAPFIRFRTSWMVSAPLRSMVFVTPPLLMTIPDAQSTPATAAVGVSSVRRASTSCPTTSHPAPASAGRCRGPSPSIRPACC